jgi:hypothetical protein
MVVAVGPFCAGSDLTLRQLPSGAVNSRDGWNLRPCHGARMEVEGQARDPGVDHAQGRGSGVADAPAAQPGIDRGPAVSGRDPVVLVPAVPARAAWGGGNAGDVHDGLQKGTGTPPRGPERGPQSRGHLSRSLVRTTA